MLRNLTLTLMCGALVMLATAATVHLGEPLTQRKATPIKTLLKSPDKYAGKTVQVEGRITEVCQKMGCWIMLVDDKSGQMVRIKVNDGEIVFPKDGSGRRAVAEGVFTKIERTLEQTIAAARHYAEEQGKPFDESTITAPSVTYQIQGTGARLLD